MNIAVTGALGHIGSKLIRLVESNSLDLIQLIDNCSSQRYVSLFNLPVGKRYCFYELDILSGDIEPVIASSDVLIHLAAITNAEASFHNPERVNEVNLQGVKNVAKLCTQHGCRLIFPSTTSIYGPQGEIVDEKCPISELRPQSPYAESKLAAEQYLHSLAMDNPRFHYVILRLGTIAGFSIGMRFHTAVNKFIWQAARGEKVTIWRTALQQKRPYCGLNDCIAAFNHIINRELFDNQIYNIVTGNFTVNDILTMIRLFLPETDIQLVDSPIMNQLSYCVSSDRSRVQGFSYHDLLEERVYETIQALKNVDYRVKKTIPEKLIAGPGDNNHAG